MSELVNARERYEQIWGDASVPLPTPCMEYVKALEAEVERLNAELATARKDALEEAAERVVNAIHAEFNINLVGKSDNHRLRSAVIRALGEKENRG